MGARESVVDCQPRKVEPMIMLNLTKWGGGGGGGLVGSEQLIMAMLRW